MALNDTFKILPKNKTSLEADLTSFLPKKEYGLQNAKSIPLKKMPFLLRLKLTFIRKLVNFAD